MNLSKENKKGIQIALDVIKSLQRHDLQWEWMDEVDDGSYILVKDAKNKLIDLLK